MGSGGTEGGIGKFVVGMCLAIGAGWLFFDSVKVSTAGYGIITGGIRQGFGHGDVWDTTSMGIIFVPFFLGVVALFYNAKWRWAWGLMWTGVGILAIEILSRIRFLFYMKTTHLLLMLIMFAAGVGLMLRSYAEEKRKS